MAHSNQSEESSDDATAIKRETKLVLDAFLKRSLIKKEHTVIGHVGRSYLDPKKYSHRLPDVAQNPEQLNQKKKHQVHDTGGPYESLDKGKQKSLKLAGRREYGSRDQDWNEVHDGINSAEEKKHGFKTSFKRLLHHNSFILGLKKETEGAHSSLSKDSVEERLDEHGKSPKKVDSKTASVKKQKAPSPFVACATVNSPQGFDEQSLEEYKEIVPDGHVVPSSKKKSSISFPFKIKLKKKSSLKVDASSSLPSSKRPTTLPVTPAYKPDDASRKVKTPGSGVDDPRFYNKVAAKLDMLAKRQQRIKSPTTLPGPPFVDNNHGLHQNFDKVTSSADKENLIQRLVDILNQQAECVNKKLDEDVDLKRSLSRMSYHSFSRLADVFTSQVETSLESQGSTTPELAKIALTMELTRKVAGINSHAVQTLMGYSMQYMDMFVPWLQQNGGWENVVQGDVVEFQID